MDGRKPRYTLAGLTAEAEASGTYPLAESEREWIDAPAVGRELHHSSGAAAVGLADKASAKSID